MTDADDLTPLLGPGPGVVPDPARREASLRATLSVRRRSQLIGRGLVALSALGVFGAGGVVGWYVKPAADPVPVVSPELQNEPPTTPPPAAPTEPPSAERLELMAELADEPSEAARLFREAGDRFLTDRDYENAARCYRRHLSVADADGRKASAADSWMLHTMKVPAR